MRVWQSAGMLDLSFQQQWSHRARALCIKISRQVIIPLGLSCSCRLFWACMTCTSSLNMQRIRNKHETDSDKAHKLQAVTLVFEHVSVSMDSMTSPTGQAYTNGFARDATDGQPDGMSSPKLARHGAANAALKLLDDLCMMATGIIVILTCHLFVCDGNCRYGFVPKHRMWESSETS